MDGCTTDRWMDGHRDSQHDTIIPQHLNVAGYKTVIYIPLKHFLGVKLSMIMHDQVVKLSMVTHVR